MRWKRGRGLLASGAFPALVAGGLACAPAAERPANVVIVTIDTLRADHLSCYGHEQPLSPRLDAFARGATRYEAAFATAPWTAPSHASLFTGLDPHEHGVVSFETDRPGRNVWPLSPRHATLAETLREEGFATAGIVANSVYLDAGFGLEQGFDLWDVRRQWAPDVTRRALAWLEHQRDRPFLLFVNYMDTHRPYNTTPLPGEEPLPEQEGSALLLDRLRQAVMVEGSAPGELAERLRARYERAVRNADAGVGDLLDGLEALGLWDRTLVVITSDHGEYFGEHGLVEHSKDVYDAALRVPLLVKRPGQRRGEVVDTEASLADVPGLVLAAMPSALRERHGEGFPRVPGKRAVIAENHYSRPHDLRQFGARFRRVRTAIRADGFKYIHSSDGRHELYQVREDPHEEVNRLAEHPEFPARLAPLLTAIEAAREERARAGAPLPLSPELRRRMAALGYLEAGPEDGVRPRSAP